MSCMRDTSCPSVRDGCPNISASAGIGGSLFFLLLNTLVNSKCKYLSEDDFPERTVLGDGDEFDFIVVGAGSAGSVVASRLAEANKQWKVLLIEAGGYPPIDSQIPSMFATLQKTDIDWAYKTQPSTVSCLGFKNKVCLWPRGKVLGGSSSLNAMVYVRGHPQDYDGWASQGNRNWSYADVLKYFKKAENYVANDIQDAHEHGTGGPLTTSRYQSESDIRDALVVASQELEGKGLGLDIHGFGLQEAPTTIEDGKRCSSAKAYLTRTKRKNLFIAVNSEVIGLSHEEKKINGVKLLIDGSIIKVKCKLEVVVSAGAVNSPKLLIQSGIGAEANLKDLGIPVVQNLPGVGQNLIDHLTTFGLFIELDKSNSTSNPLDDMYTYMTKNTGPLSGIGITNMVWFIHSNGKDRSIEVPDLQLHFWEFQHGDRNFMNVLSNDLGINDQTAKSLIEVIDRSRLLLVCITLLYPKSKGHINFINDDEGNLNMQIIPNYLTNDDDVDVLIKGIDFVSKLLSTTEMKRKNARFASYDTVNCKEHAHESRDYWECSLRNFASTLYHPVGTCSMGTNVATGAVVDDELKVWGVSGLRVIDASIMPNIVGGNTNVPTIMIGEKGADLIIKTYLHGNNN